MANRNDASDGEAIALADAFANKYVYIKCHPNRYLHVVPAAATKSKTNADRDESTVKTVTNRQLATCVVMERLTPDEERRFGSKSGLVSFRVLPQKVEEPDPRYLTIELYGDEIRQAATAALSSKSVLLLPDLIPDIIDYAFGRGTAESNFEGPGFDYSPLTAAPCSSRKSNDGDRGPNMMQVFQLTSEPGGGRYSYGIKSLFNTYWRSQHWVGVLSQSPHCLADEKFVFLDINQIAGTRLTMTDW